jgi:uncharacterized membrane protein
MHPYAAVMLCALLGIAAWMLPGQLKFFALLLFFIVLFAPSRFE